MKNILISFVFVPLLFGCNKFEDYQSDPNRTTTATPGLILTNLQVETFNAISLEASLASRYLVNINLVSEYQYYGWNQGSYYGYQLLRQVLKLEEEAMKKEDQNYIAIAKFFKAYLFEQITRQFGDVPYSSALKGEEGEYRPAYDSQEDIYVDILRLLREASQEISPVNGVISGDIIYWGDHLKWKKLINSYRLRVLMNLSRKTGNTRLNVINEFNDIFSQPADFPVIISNADNCAYFFSFTNGNLYPFYQKAYILTAHILEESFVNRLKTLEDPRLFVMADQEGRHQGGDIYDFNTYGGFRGSDGIDVNTDRLGNGEGSPIDARYIDDPEPESNLAFGYAELSFILAEAAQRGWITADPSVYYNKGIQASMQYYGVGTSAINNYLANPAVVFDPANGLEMILTQKHTAMFLNSGWEPFYNQRRTGFPEFDVSGSGMMNEGRIPKRWMYPTSEIELNVENLSEAVNRQFPGGDDINAVMWLLKEE